MHDEPPFRRAGSARPSVTCYTDEDLTSATQRPYGGGNGLRWFRDRTTADALARGHGVSRATAYRYLDEVILVLAEQAQTCAERWNGPRTRDLRT